MSQINLSIPKIHCPACEKLVKISLNETAGIKAVSIDLNKKTATINFDENVVSPSQIQQTIQQESGYSSTVIK